MKKRGLILFLSILHVCFLQAEPNGDSIAQNRFREGKSKFLTGDDYKVLDALCESLSLNFSNTESRLLKATTVYNLKLYPEADKDDELLLEISPKSFLAWNMKARCVEKKNKFKIAFSNFDKCLQLNPTYTEAWLDRGLLELRLMHYVKCYRRLYGTPENSTTLRKSFLPERQGEV